MRAKLNLSPTEFLVVCVARLEAQKRIDILLSAIARLRQMGTRCKCLIIGDGSLRDSLAKQALMLNLAGDVVFAGFQDVVRPYLQAADVFVLTSQYEGLPIAILEAMACGVPCVVTDVGGNAEAVAHNVNGLLVSSGAVEEVADRISYLVTHPQERAEMSRMARIRACTAFDIRDQMAAIRDLLLRDA
jgi:glycosyltransferase involved in cell wall biosynthesis